MTTSDVRPPTAAFEPVAGGPGDYAGNGAVPFLHGLGHRHLHHAAAYRYPYAMEQPFYNATDPNVYLLAHAVPTPASSATLASPAYLPSRDITPPTHHVLSSMHLPPLHASAYPAVSHASSALASPALSMLPPPALSVSSTTGHGQELHGSDKHQPTLSRQERTVMIGKLVDVSANIIDSIWNPRFLMDQQRNAKVVSTKRFIQEMLKRSKITYSTLQISLFYLFRVKRVVHERLRQRLTQGYPKQRIPATQTPMRTKTTATLAAAAAAAETTETTEATTTATATATATTTTTTITSAENAITNATANSMINVITHPPIYTVDIKVTTTVVNAGGTSTANHLAPYDLPPSPPSSQHEHLEDSDDAQHEPHAHEKKEPVSDRLDDLMCCGRRMFLASLMVASKYLHDKNYRNRAWAKMSGLDIAEVNAAELAFLQLIDYKLFVSKPTFEKWQTMLNGLTNSDMIGK